MIAVGTTLNDSLQELIKRADTSRPLYRPMFPFISVAVTHENPFGVGVGEGVAEGNNVGFVNIYVNGEDVRFLQGLETSTSTGDEISIVPAVAGG